MPSKMSIYMYAQSIARNNSMDDKNDYQNTCDGELLKEIYDQAMEIPPNWVAGGANNNLKAIQEGKWLRKDGTPGGTTVESSGIAWCGIFATYILRGIGVPVKWRAFVGIAPLEPYLELCSYAKADEIEPGDICVKGTNQHHFIVYNRVGNTLYSFDGNLPNQSVGRRHYEISEMIKAAKDADIETAQKKQTMSSEAFRNYVQTHSKYSFYFYRLRKI